MDVRSQMRSAANDNDLLHCASILTTGVGVLEDNTLRPCIRATARPSYHLLR